MSVPAFGYYLAGQRVAANDELAVFDKFQGDVMARVALADRETVLAAIAAAHASREHVAATPPDFRRDVLLHCARRFEERSDELADLLCGEAGKPIRDSRGEVARLIETFQVAAEEATRQNGEVLNLEFSPRSRGRLGFTRRFPVGVCGLISPFNFPLNLAAHKIAPAIAAGCPFVLKPASRTPLGALVIGEVLAETQWPADAWSILPASREAADPLTTDERIALLSFTGSPAVGWQLKQRCGRKKIVLELGGNAACLVDADADLDDVVDRLLIGAFYQSGQSCISVQRILIHRSIYPQLRERLVAATRKLVVGNPRDEATFIGPLIDDAAADRLSAWLRAAEAAGGRILCGGELDGRLMSPTLLEDVPPDAELSAQEAFGPVALLQPFDDFETALAEINHSRFGLQAGLFVRDWEKIQRAWEVLEVGGVIIGDVPSWRVDAMPYGGVKESGLGREGLRYAIEEMTEPRLLVVRRPNA